MLFNLFFMFFPRRCFFQDAMEVRLFKDHDGIQLMGEELVGPNTANLLQCIPCCLRLLTFLRALWNTGAWSRQRHLNLEACPLSRLPNPNTLTAGRLYFNTGTLAPKRLLAWNSAHGPCSRAMFRTWHCSSKNPLWFGAPSCWTGLLMPGFFRSLYAFTFSAKLAQISLHLSTTSKISKVTADSCRCSTWNKDAQRCWTSASCKPSGSSTGGIVGDRPSAQPWSNLSWYGLCTNHVSDSSNVTLLMYVQHWRLSSSFCLWALLCSKATVMFTEPTSGRCDSTSIMKMFEKQTQGDFQQATLNPPFPKPIVLWCCHPPCQFH